MKFIIKTTNLINTIIIIVSLSISGLFFLFGIANLINPEVADEYLVQNTTICLLLCLAGLIFLLIALASLRGILKACN